jgi:hypothetical protein
MLKQLKSTCAAGLLLLSVLAFSACDDRLLSDDYGPCPGSSSEAADSAALYLSFTMRVAGSGDTRADDVTWGGVYTTDETAYDAVINPEEVHVALFSEAGEYLSEVQRITCSEITAGTYQYYGLLDAEQLTEGSPYRCMVVANAGDVDFTQLSTLTYQASDLPQGGDTHSFYIPMWGVQTFTLQKGNSEMKTIEMLRAAAKCRIHFSEELLKEATEEISLKSVEFHSYNTDGYVVPTGYSEVSKTTKLSYTNCFNPTEAQPTYAMTEFNGFLLEVEQTYDPIPFIAEPNQTQIDGGMRHAVGYFPECQIETNQKAYLSITIQSKSQDNTVIESTYDVPFYEPGSTSTLRENLVRNHVYDLTITKILHQLSITIKADTWERQYSSINFLQEISFQEKYGEGVIKWESSESGSTYGAIDQENKTITLLKGVTLVGTIGFRTPVGGTVLATLTSADADDTANAIVFVEDRNVEADENGIVAGTTYISVEIDGLKLVTLRIRAAEENNTRQHRSKLQIYVKYANGTTQKVEALGEWTIIQTY